MSTLFGRRADGTPVRSLELSNSNGVRVRILTLGALIQSLYVPDRRGVLGDIVLGHETVQEYETKRQYFGATVGRYANRIAAGEFMLGGEKIVLDINDGPHHLHGGKMGFDMANWSIDAFDATTRTAVLSHLSRAGESGYPGTCRVTARYALSSDNTLSIEYRAQCDAPTIANITHHGYFNLAGADSDLDVLDHHLQLNAARYTPINATLIPTGELRAVVGSPFDFTQPRQIRERIGERHEQLLFAGGYDHNFVIDGPSPALRTAAMVIEPVSGRRMELLTSEPGVQFYSGNFLDGTTRGKNGKPYRQHQGLCLEPQHFPNSPNEPSFPSTVLMPGDIYTNRLVFKFSET